MTGISPSRALLSLRLAHLKIGIHGCANWQSLLCLKSAVGIRSMPRKQSASVLVKMHVHYSVK